MIAFDFRKILIQFTIWNLFQYSIHPTTVAEEDLVTDDVAINISRNEKKFFLFSHKNINHLFHPWTNKIIEITKKSMFSLNCSTYLLLSIFFSYESISRFGKNYQSIFMTTYFHAWQFFCSFNYRTHPHESAETKIPRETMKKKPIPTL